MVMVIIGPWTISAINLCDLTLTSVKGSVDVKVLALVQTPINSDGKCAFGISGERFEIINICVCNNPEI